MSSDGAVMGATLRRHCALIIHHMSRPTRSMPLVLFVLLGQGAMAQSPVSEVRIGGLFPLSRGVSNVGRLAAFVMAVQEINDSPDLLPDVRLR